MRQRCNPKDRITPARALRYARFLVTTLKYRPYGVWVRAGEPNPLAKKVYRLRATSRLEIEETFEGNLHRHRLRLLCARCLNKGKVPCSVNECAEHRRKLP